MFISYYWGVESLWGGAE